MVQPEQLKLSLRNLYKIQRFKQKLVIIFSLVIKKLRYISIVLMLNSIYKKIITDFSKITLFFLSILIAFSLYQSKNFNLDASSDALLLEEILI